MNLWEYDAQGVLVATDSEDWEVLGQAFDYAGCLDEMLACAREGAIQQPRPVLLGAESDLVWAAVFELGAEGVERCYVLGPVFLTEKLKQHNVSAFLIQGSSDELADWNRRLGKAMRALPVIPSTLFASDAAMLHYCVCGEKLLYNEVVGHVDRGSGDDALIYAGHDRNAVWAHERALFDLVRNGDVDYASHFGRSGSVSGGVPVKGRDHLRQAKTSVIVFVSLTCRAAMEGGLSPEVAYPLGDVYIQEIENASSMVEVAKVSNTMFDDFIHRVHDAQLASIGSEPVRLCCDYIRAHLDEKIGAKDLAKVTGYSPYYLTKLFRDELGTSLTDYVRAAKVERAKALLETTGKSVQEIADELKFSSRGYFCSVFAQVTGMTPKEWRDASHRPVAFTSSSAKA